MLPAVTWLTLIINTQIAVLMVWKENWSQSRIIFHKNVSKLKKIKTVSDEVPAPISSYTTKASFFFYELELPPVIITSW